MKQKREYLVKDVTGYLVKGSINGQPFDGKGQPYKFTRKEAELLVEVMEKGELEKLPPLCEDCYIKDKCPIRGSVSHAGYCNAYQKED